jgi:uncharacterized membrane protein YeaQ/YmgE (transglycosylase-associated protein family)
MRGWLRYLELTAKSMTGLSARVFVMGFVAVLCAAVTVGFFIYAIFVWLAERLIARLLAPGPNKPSGFILTTVLGIAGAFLATFIGQSIGWYRLDQGAGLIGATVGAVLVLFIWNRLVVSRAISDPSTPSNSGPRHSF